MLGERGPHGAGGTVATLSDFRSSVDRAPDELLSINDTPIAPAGAGALNPVFDVTPAEYIDALVTEDGVIVKPDREQMAALF